MAEIASTFKNINFDNNLSVTSDFNDSSSLRSVSPRSSTSITSWTIKYKTISKKSESQGIWDGYQTREEFMMIHLR